MQVLVISRDSKLSILEVPRCCPFMEIAERKETFDPFKIPDPAAEPNLLRIRFFSRVPFLLTDMQGANMETDLLSVYEECR